MSDKTVGGIAEKLIGSWRYLGTQIDGKAWDRGANPKGMIYYGPRNEMAVQIAPDVERKRAGAMMTAEEAKIALTDYIAYFGTFSIDERAQTVTHHRLGSVQPGDTVDLVRKFTIDGDRLRLNPPGTTYEVHWQRLK